MAAVQRKISGSTMLLFIDPTGGTTYVPAICLTSQSFSLANNEIDAKTKCGPDKLPGTQDFNVDFEGQLILSPTGSSLGYMDLVTLALNKTTIGWKYGPAVPVEGDVVITGSGFLSKFDSTSGQDEPSTFSSSIGVYGSPVFTETPA